MENNMSTTHFKTVGSLYAIDNQWLRYWYYSAW
jgi:hypothetical protein